MESNKKIETKIVQTNDLFRCIYINESFGWRYVDDNDNNVTFEREIQNTEEFKKIINNENIYYNLTFNKNYENPKKLNVVLLILLFLMFIIPGIIYLVVFYLKNKKSSFSKQDYENGLKDFWQKSNMLLWESRQLSFGSNNVQLLDFSKTDKLGTSYINKDFEESKMNEISNSFGYISKGRHDGGFNQFFDDIPNSQGSIQQVSNHSFGGKTTKTSNGPKKKFNWGLFILLWCMFMIPGIIYLVSYFVKK